MQTLLSIAVVIFEANDSNSGELVETKGGAQSVGGSSRRKHRPSQGDEDFDEDYHRRDDDDEDDVGEDIYIMMSVCLFVCNEKSSLFLGKIVFEFFFLKIVFF